MRRRAAVLVIQDQKLLLIHRKRNGRYYYVVPGGGVETYESAEAAARRELLEETGLDVKLDGIFLEFEQAYPRPQKNTVFLSRFCTGALRLGKNSPERQRQNSVNRYEPVWIELAKLDSLPLVPEELKRTLITRLPELTAK